MSIKPLNNYSLINNASTVFLTGNRPFYWFTFICILLYGQTITYGFSPLDDSMLIVSRIDWLKDIRNIVLIFTKPLYFGVGEYYYRPILILTFMTDTIIGSGFPWVYHFTNVLLHLLTSFIIFRLFQKVGMSIPASFLLSVIFIVHPINVSAVAWIPGRNDTILAIFSFLSFICWIDFLKSGKRKLLSYHLILFFFALLTKENGIVIIPLAALYYYLFFRKNNKLLDWKIATAWFSIIIFWLLIRLSVLENPQHLDIKSFSTIIHSLSIIFIITFERLIFPIYQYVSPNLLDISPYPGFVIFILSILSFLFIKIKNVHKFLFGLSWLVLFLIIPELWVSVFGIGYTYEHRLYIPLFGFLLMITQIKLPKKIFFHRTYRIVAIISLLCFFSIRTFVRSNVFKNLLNYSQALALESPSMPFASEFRGAMLLGEGKNKEAANYFTRALTFDSTRADIYIKRAVAFENDDKFDKSILDLNKAIGLDSTLSEAYFRKGNIFRKIDLPDRAIDNFTKAIQLDPTEKTYFNDRGLLYLNLKNAGKAIADFTQAIQIDSTFTLAYQNRSAAFFLTGNYEQALEDQFAIEKTGGTINLDFLTQLFNHLQSNK